MTELQLRPKHERAGGIETLDRLASELRSRGVERGMDPIQHAGKYLRWAESAEASPSAGVRVD